MNNFAIAALTVFTVAGQPDNAGFTDALTAVKAGQRGCPHCVLAGADLANKCLQGADFRGADLDNSRLVLTCLSSSDLRGATLRGADLSGANLAGSNLDGADLTGAVLNIASIKGAKMSKAKGLTQAQLDAACGDAWTRLPAGLMAKVCE